MDNILASIKTMLGLDPEDTSFDVDVTIHINSAISKIYLIGVVPPIGFRVTTEDTELWSELLGDTSINMLDMVKTYIYLIVRLIFDPPQNSFLVSAIEKQIKEYAWDISILAEG